MKARPILFTAPMIRALLDCRKVQTRRVAKEITYDVGADVWRWKGGRHIGKSTLWEQAVVDMATVIAGCPYGQPGDLLWVKESWAYRLDCDHLNGTQLYERGVRQAWYWADGPGKTCRTGCAGAAGRVRAARFMPRWASRLTLKITEVRVQRLQEISSADSIAEGCPAHANSQTIDCDTRDPRDDYRALWESINGPGSWEANPWVWAISFETIKANVDAVIGGQRE